MWGRLQSGARSQAAAEEELRSLARELRKQHPNDIWEKETLPSDPAAMRRA